MKLGIKFTPELLAQFFESGGIPSSHKLSNYGYDKDNDEFFLIWESPGCPEGTAVEWTQVNWKTISQGVDTLTKEVSERAQGT